MHKMREDLQQENQSSEPHCECPLGSATGHMSVLQSHLQEQEQPSGTHQRHTQVLHAVAVMSSNETSEAGYH